MSDEKAKVVGHQTDSSGETYGVWGEVDSTDGFGLYTPDDGKIDGALHVNALGGGLTGATQLVDIAGPGLIIDDGELTVTGGGGDSNWQDAGDDLLEPAGGFTGARVDDLQVDDVVEASDEWRVETSDGTDGGNVVQGHPDNIVDDAVGATIAGGGQTDGENEITDDYATIGGGFGNKAMGNRDTIGGGQENTTDGSRATVGGGRRNTATGNRSTIGGGSYNEALEAFATIGGGWSNTASGLRATVAGGRHNVASGERSVVGGGGSAPALGADPDDGNEAHGVASVVPGGASNEAGGTWSFAAGRGATIDENHHGSFVWSDSTGDDGDEFVPFDSDAENEFAARATGGVRLVTGLDDEDEPDTGFFCQDDTARFEMDTVSINTTSSAARLYVEADSDVDSQLLRVRDDGATKLMVDDNGGTSIGTYTSPPEDGLRVSGDIEANGDKNFVHRIGDEEIVYSSQESGNARTVWDAANVVLTGGSGRVDLPDHFVAVTSASEPLTVQVTPNGTPVAVAVEEKLLDGIMVVTDSEEDVEVDVTVKGIRKGYEDKEIVRPISDEAEEEG